MRIILKVDVPINEVTAGNNIMMEAVKYHIERSLQKEQWINPCVVEIMVVKK